MKTDFLVAKGIAVSVSVIAFAVMVYSPHALAQVPSIGGTVESCDSGRTWSTSCGGGRGGSGGGGSRGPDILDSLIENVIGPLLGYSSPAERARKQRAYDLTNEGVELSRRGDRRGALAKYREALSLDPSSRAIRFNIANNEAILAYEAGDLPLAIAKAREGLPYADNPAFDEWLKGLEKEFAEQQRGEQAYALNEEGRELWQKGDIKGALAKFQAALALSPSDTYRGNVALAEQRLVDQQAKEQDVQNLRAAARGALGPLKPDPSATPQLSLEAFRPGNPPPEEVASYLTTGQSSARGQAGSGRPAPAGDQLMSAGASGETARQIVKKPQSSPQSESASDSEVPAAVEQARLVFDTPGQAAGSLPTIHLSAMQRSSDGAPIIPPERRTQAIRQLEAKRDDFRAKRLELGQEISKLDTKLADPSLPGGERQTLLVKKAELKQEEFTNRQQEIFLNFSIELEDAKSLGPRAETNVPPRQSEPAGPATSPAPGGASAAEGRPLRP